MDATGLRVSDVMTRNVVAIHPNEKLTDADGLLENRRIRHLPVVDDGGALVGIVSQRDLFHGGLVHAIGFSKEGSLEGFRARNVMNSEVATATPNMRLDAAAEIMVTRKIGCLPVIENGKLVGMLTETDLVRLIARAHASPSDSERIRAL